MNNIKCEISNNYYVYVQSLIIYKHALMFINNSILTPGLRKACKQSNAS